MGGGGAFVHGRGCFVSNLAKAFLVALAVPFLVSWSTARETDAPLFKAAKHLAIRISSL